MRFWVGAEGEGVVGVLRSGYESLDVGRMVLRVG